MINFSVEQIKKLDDWLKEHDKTCRFGDPTKCGCIGGRLTYLITPTTLGPIYKARCACNAEIDLTAYEEW